MEPGIPFDNKRGIIPNENGKIANVPGLFCAGWLATGPRGVIVNTMTEAFKVGQTVIENMSSLINENKPGLKSIKHLLKERNVKPVSFQDWKTIDAKEKELGHASGKPREKMTTVHSMVSTLNINNNDL